MTNWSSTAEPRFWEKVQLPEDIGLCWLQRIVNPMHLELVTYGVNNARASKSSCPQGHEFTPENTLINSLGWRYCRECNRVRCTERYTAKRLARIEGI